jgi:hypothetical protein
MGRLMDWPTARAEIANILATLEITAPVAASIARVYDQPDATVQDLPCLILFPAGVETERGFGTRQEVWTMPITLLVGDADLPTRAAMVEAFLVELSALFDSHVTLGGKASIVGKQQMAPPGTFTIGNRKVAGSEGNIIVTIKAQKAMTP